jgi:predicted signal transduction protein with EAL and GGDEF domain
MAESFNTSLDLSQEAKRAINRWMGKLLGWLRPDFMNQVERPGWILQELLRAVIFGIA